jgi:hypothetical protein
MLCVCFAPKALNHSSLGAAPQDSDKAVKREPCENCTGTQTFKSVRTAELHSAAERKESGQNVRLAHRPQACVPLGRSRAKLKE